MAPWGARQLARGEINLLKHLSRFSPTGIPIAVPSKFQSAFVPLWRRALIDIWYRQNRDAPGTRNAQFVSITVDGAKRIDTILSQRSGKHD